MESDVNKSTSSSHKRPSLFWPVVLILIGVVLLLQNLSGQAANFWELVATYWPVLLILMGLDSLWQGDGLSGPLLLIGAGAVFLLGNLGYQVVNIWDLILNLWPVFLIALGVDLVMAHRPWWAKLAGTLVVLAVLVGVMFLVGIDFRTPGVQTPVGGTTFRGDLSGLTSAQVNLKPGAGELRVAGGASEGVLIEGSLPEERFQSIAQEFITEGERATFSLRETGMTNIMPGRKGSWVWDIQLNEEIPLELIADMGVGSIELDLSGVMLAGLDVNLGVGSIEVHLPVGADLRSDVRSGIGQVTLIVPAGAALQVATDTGIGNVNAPDDFVRNGDLYTSPGFDQAERKMYLTVSSGIGQVVIRVVE